MIRLTSSLYWHKGCRFVYVHHYGGGVWCEVSPEGLVAMPTLER